MRQDTLVRILNQQIQDSAQKVDRRATRSLETRRRETADKRVGALDRRIQQLDQLLWSIDAGIAYLEAENG